MSSVSGNQDPADDPASSRPPITSSDLGAP